MPADSFSDSDLPAKSPQNAPVTKSARHGDVIAVSELNRRVRNLLEAKLELLWVGGELSNVMRAASGHWYFSLKDATAQVRCVMFKNRAAAIGFNPENGMQVEVRALPSLYEPRGEFQLGVENMRRAGLGALFEAFERLKVRLQAEGLFNEERKSALPTFPQVIGIVTSLKAAALRDVLTTLKRRAPMIEVIVYPALVQGSTAAEEIAGAIDCARNRLGTDLIDALIICRGGGSIEDLSPFNEEIVARAIIRLQNDTGVAVVSGVGHETDFTICDFVADQRAPTPTAAAELLSPDVEELRAQVAQIRQSLARALRRTLDGAGQRLDRAGRNLVSPAERLRRERERLTQIMTRARNGVGNRLDSCRFRFTLLNQKIAACKPVTTSLRAELRRRQHRLVMANAQIVAGKHAQLLAARHALLFLDPARVLERGYSIVEHRGMVLRDASEVAVGDSLKVRLAVGNLEASVTSTGIDEEK